MNHAPESLLALTKSPDMNTDTPPQPAHGEPWPDAYEVHSKETMDEVRELLGDFLDRVKLHGNRKETELIESTLAKLNPPQ